MKKLLLMSMVVAAGLTWAEAAKMSLADAEAKIASAIEDTKVMSSTMSSLSAQDQVAFLSKVNAAIGEYKGSEEEKAALYVNANSTAMKSAAKGNLPSLLAETFATVPLEALTVINERFAADLFSRSADPSKSYDDKTFMEVSKSALDVICKRCENCDTPGVRDGFAALMFVRASEGSPKDVRETLANCLPAGDTPELALQEWFPDAMGDNGAKPSYDSMLGVRSKFYTRGIDRIYLYAGPQEMVALMGDLQQGLLNANGEFMTPVWDAIQPLDYEMGDSLLSPENNFSLVPRSQREDKPWNNRKKRGEKDEPDEPKPYPYSNL